MKKVLIGLLVVVMVLSLTACSQELADLMGKMSNNVYGIPADTSAADAAAAKVDSAVTTKENGDIEISLSTAAEITSSISTIKDSPEKTKAFKDQISEPVAKTEEEAAKVKEALVAEATKVADSLAEAAESNEIVAEIKAALDDLASSISDNPTKAELATVAIISEIANTVSEFDKESAESLTEEEINDLIDQGMGAYETLTLVTEVSNINLVKDLNLMAIVSSISKDVSRADDGFDVKVFKTTVAKILGLITKDKSFDSGMYKSFIFQAKAIKASIDAVAKIYTEEDPNAILAKSINCGLTVDDLLLYLVSSLFVEADKLGGEAWRTFAEEYVNANYDALASLGDVEFKDTSVEKFYAAMLAIDTNVDGTLTSGTKETILEELGNDMKYAIANQTQSVFTADIFNILRTAAVIIVDAEYKGILSLGDGDGTITGLLNMIK